MSDLQKTIALSIGVTVFLCLALGGGMLFTRLLTRPAVPPAAVVVAPAVATTSGGPSAGGADGANAEGNLLSRMVQAQAALVRAHEALAKASTKNHGGFVEKARTTANAAQRDMESAMSFIAEHPDVKLRTTDETTTVRPAAIPKYDVKADGTYGSPNLAHAIIALNEALAQFTSSPGSEHLISADLGGMREQVLNDIDQTNGHILEAYAFARKSVAAAPAPPAGPEGVGAPGPGASATRSNLP